MQLLYCIQSTPQNSGEGGLVQSRMEISIKIALAQSNYGGIMDRYIHAIGGSIAFRYFLMKIERKTTCAIVPKSFSILPCGCKRQLVNEELFVKKNKFKSTLWKCVNGHIVGVCANNQEKGKRVLDFITGEQENV